MKWIKKFFGKKESEPAETVLRKISPEELPVWLETGFQKLSGEISENAALILKDLEASLPEITESKTRLSEALVVGDFDVRAVKRAKSNRENMARQIEILVEKISIPESQDVKSLGEFHEKTAHQLNSCVENMSRSLRYAGGIFPKEAKEVTESLGKLGMILKALQESFGTHSKEIEAYETASETLQAIRDLSASSELGKKEIRQQKEKIRSFEGEIEEARKAHENFEQSEEWQNYRKLEAELAEAGGLTKKAESNLSSLVLPLSDNLTRLKKLHETGRYTLNPEIRKELDACLEDPKTASPAFFRKLQKLFEDPTLGLKAQKKEKALAQAEVAVLNFETRKKEYLEAVQTREEKRAELKKLGAGGLEELKQKETKLQGKCRLAGEELQLSMKKLEKLNTDLEKKKEELREKVALIDSGVELAFPD